MGDLEPAPISKSELSTSQITFSDVTPLSASTLAELRQSIDKVKPAKAIPESQKFASREGGRFAQIVVENFLFEF